jgi:hypothetical protein
MPASGMQNLQDAAEAPSISSPNAVDAVYPEEIS